MASNETIKNLSTLLGALRDFNQPQRELDMYAKKRLIDMNIESELAEMKRIEAEKAMDLLEQKRRISLGPEVIRRKLEGDIPGVKSTIEEASGEIYGPIRTSLVKGLGVSGLRQLPGTDFDIEGYERGEDIVNALDVVREAAASYQPTLSPQGQEIVTDEQVRDFNMYKQYLQGLDIERLDTNNREQYNQLLDYLNIYAD